nr:Nuclear pore complex protein Nup153 [Hymenolepis microstoma]
MKNVPMKNKILSHSINALLSSSTPDVTSSETSLSTFHLFGEPLACLVLNGEERLCLAQISTRLLRDFTYNEIHNRRVALGITCVQCSPPQLDLLRRVGAMPLSSRRCGTITKREAQRLVESFLQHYLPAAKPRLPENFAFEVIHHCGWGCTGFFVPARYNSSRAKCVQCTFCHAFFSPNKFIFHCHSATETGVQPSLTTYRHPDAANFNAWRRHLLLADPNPPDTLLFAWEDIKAMFNGGNRTKKTTSITLPSPCQPPGNNVIVKPKTPDMPIDILSIGSPPKAIFASLVAQRMAPLGCNVRDTGVMSDRMSGSASNRERRGNRRKSLFSRITDTIASFIPSLFESRQPESMRQLEADEELVRPAKRPRTSEASVSVESPPINRLSISRVGTVNLPSVTLTLPMNVEVDLDAKEDGSDLSVSTSGVSSLLPRSSRNGQYLVEPSPVDYRADYISQRDDTSVRKRQNTELWTESASKRMRQDDHQSSTSQQSTFTSSFYHGRVSYGGAASVRPVNQKKGLFDNVTPMKFIIENEDKEKPKPQPAFLSNAAQSILVSLERHGSSIASSDRIPLPRSNPFSPFATPLTKNTTRYQPYLSTYNRYKQFKRQNASQPVIGLAENGTETSDVSKSETPSVTPKISVFNVSNSTSQPMPSTSYAKLPNPPASQPIPSTSFAHSSPSNSCLGSAKPDADNGESPSFAFSHPLPSISYGSSSVSAEDNHPVPSNSCTASNSHVESVKTVIDNQKLPNFDIAKTAQSIPSTSYTKLPFERPQTALSTSGSHVDSVKADQDNQNCPTVGAPSKTAQCNPSTSRVKLPGVSILKSSKKSIESAQKASTEIPNVRFASESQYIEKSTSKNENSPVFIFSHPICIKKPEENSEELQAELIEKPVFTFSRPEYAFKKAVSVEQSTFLPTLISPIKTNSITTPARKGWLII